MFTGNGRNCGRDYLLKCPVLAWIKFFARYCIWPCGSLLNPVTDDCQFVCRQRGLVRRHTLRFVCRHEPCKQAAFCELFRNHGRLPRLTASQRGATYVQSQIGSTFAAVMAFVTVPLQQRLHVSRIVNLTILCRGDETVGKEYKNWQRVPRRQRQ